MERLEKLIGTRLSQIDREVERQGVFEKKMKRLMAFRAIIKFLKDKRKCK